VGKPTGFIEFERADAPKRPVTERLRDFREFEERMPEQQTRQQASRCMDCGVPFCHAHGCPVENRIPEWLDLTYRGRFRDAYDLLDSTDNFPEFTGRVCPAPCEAACTLGINQPAVTIRNVELEIIERAFREGWVRPRPAHHRSGYRVGIVGSGPAGLAAAQQLARLGHSVTVYERDAKVGGLLRYGIPDFKLEKWVIDRRIEQMISEGVRFETNFAVGPASAGGKMTTGDLVSRHDALVLAIGSGTPRDVVAGGRELAGIHYAMSFLGRQNRVVSGEIRDVPGEDPALSAKGKHVVVIGGGDTGSDCIGTSNRHGAASVTQIEILARPPDLTAALNPQWPDWPRIYRESSSQEEGCQRLFSISTKGFNGEHGRVTGLRCAKVEWKADAAGRVGPVEIPGSDFVLAADLVLIAAGFIHPEAEGPVADLGLKLDGRGNIEVNRDNMTSRRGVFAAGDAALGASLVVRALAQGRKVAVGVHRFLAGAAEERRSPISYAGL